MNYRSHGQSNEHLNHYIDFLYNPGIRVSAKLYSVPKKDD